MKLNSRGSVVCSLAAVLALAACSGAEGFSEDGLPSEGELSEEGLSEESIGTVEQGLSFGTWAAVPNTCSGGGACVVPGEAFGAAFAPKADHTVWAYVVPFSNLRRNVQVSGTWTGWGTASESNVAAKPALVSWTGAVTRNMLGAYVGFDHQVRVASAASGEGVFGAFTAISGSGCPNRLTCSTDIASAQPALAYTKSGDGVVKQVFLFVKKTDNKVYFKRNLLGVNGSYSHANWETNWTKLSDQTIEGSVAAAGTSSVQSSGRISVLVTIDPPPVGGNHSCRVARITTNSAGPIISGFTTCGGAGLPVPTSWSTPAIATKGSNDNTSARVVIRGSDGVLKTAILDTVLGTDSWSSWTSVPNNGTCAGVFPAGDPALSMKDFDTTMAIGATCGSSSTLSWIQVTN